MALTKTQTNQLADKFSQIFSEEKYELGQRLRTEDEVTYERIIDQALKAEAFPIDANAFNVEHTLFINQGQSAEQWANDFIEETQISTAEEFNNAINHHLYPHIFDNLDKTSLNVEIKEDLQHWLEKHGTVEYLEEEMQKEFDVHEFEEYIMQEDDDKKKEKIKEALREEGFPEKLNPDDVNYLINNIRLKVSFEELAERHIDEVEASGGVTPYLNNRFYKDILNANAYDYDVEITEDIQDYQ